MWALFLVGPALATLRAKFESDGTVEMQVDAASPGGMAEALPLAAIPGKPHGVRNLDDDGEYTSARNVELGRKPAAPAQAPRAEPLHGDVADEDDDEVNVVFAEVSDDGESIAVPTKHEKAPERPTLDEDVPPDDHEVSGVRSTPEQHGSAGRGEQPAEQALVEAVAKIAVDSAAEASVDNADAEGASLGDRRRAGPMFGVAGETETEALAQLDVLEQAEDVSAHPRGDRRRAYWNTGESPPSAAGFAEPLMSAAKEPEATALLEGGAAEAGRRRLAADWSRPPTNPALKDSQRRRLPADWAPPPKLPLDEDASLVEQHAVATEDVEKNSRRRLPADWKRPPRIEVEDLEDEDEDEAEFFDPEALLEEDEVGTPPEPAKAVYDGSRRRLPANFSWSQMGAKVVAA